MSNYNNHHTVAVILAAGSGSRMGMDIPKQNILLCGKDILTRSIDAFEACDLVDSIVVVARPSDCDDVRQRLISHKTKVFDVIPGGATRVESARLGFLSIPESSSFVAFHDAARCLVTPEQIAEVIRCAHKYSAATAATASTDTLKRVEDGFIIETVPREHIYCAQTPQVFAYDLYKRAIEHDMWMGFTDDNSLVEHIGTKIRCVDIGRNNIKITTEEDLEYAEFLLKKRGDSYD